MSQSKQKPLKVRKREGKKKFKDNKIKVFFYNCTGAKNQSFSFQKTAEEKVA